MSFAANLRRLTEATSDLVFLDLPRRVAKVLLSQPRGPDGLIWPPVSQEELAHQAGGSRPSVNATLRGFERRGWIQVRGRAVTVTPAAALSRFARTACQQAASDCVSRLTDNRAAIRRADSSWSLQTGLQMGRGAPPGHHGRAERRHMPKAGKTTSSARGTAAYMRGQRDPQAGTKLGRARGRYTKFADHLARLKATEPHATAERVIELEREAAQATRQPAAYTDVTVSFSKSISVLHASIRENARQARIAGDHRALAYWSGREEKFQQILHRANRAALEYLQEWAGVTRTGYQGVRVDGHDPGRFEEAGLIVTSWLQGTSRDGDPQDHVHNQIARITRTTRDGKWHALDTASLRGVLGALQGIAATAVECELTREFGVAWIPRTDGRANEIRGVTQAQLDAYWTLTRRDSSFVDCRRRSIRVF